MWLLLSLKKRELRFKMAQKQGVIISMATLGDEGCTMGEAWFEEPLVNFWPGEDDPHS